jgi:hypothetical protein
MLLLFRGLKSRQSAPTALLGGKVNRPGFVAAPQRKKAALAAKDSSDPAMIAG